MKERSTSGFLFPAIGIFVGLPLLLWALGDFPRRTVLKEALSLLFILAYFLMLVQFYLARGGRLLLTMPKMSTILKYHKAIGYIFASILLAHPFLIVIPRYYEAGTTPMEAFITIITTFESSGVVIGIIAWFLMLALGITSLTRNRLPMKYRTWKTVHCIMSVLFIASGTWHAVDLGRHTNLPMSICMILLALGGVVLLLKTYFHDSSIREGHTS